MKKLYNLFAVALATFAMTSCFDDAGNEVFFEGNQVEFADAKLPTGLTSSYVRLSSTQTDLAELGLNRVSTSSTDAITVTVEADPSSTAIEGVHYSLSSNSATIAAGEFVGSFPVTVLTGNIDPSETPDLVLNITSAQGAEVASNYGSITFKIRVICPSELAGTYSVFWEFLQTGDGAGGPNQTAQNVVLADASTMSFTEAGTGEYLMDDMSFGMYPSVYDEAKPVGNISDSCGELTGAASNQDRFGDPFTMSGLVNEDDTITITWSNTWGDGGTVILTKN